LIYLVSVGGDRTPDLLIATRCLFLPGIKKSLQDIQRPHDSLLFFNEASFGAYSKLGYNWFPSGIRTKVKAKLGLKRFH
jgi:hypothetical protein